MEACRRRNEEKEREGIPATTKQRRPHHQPTPPVPSSPAATAPLPPKLSLSLSLHFAHLATFQPILRAPSPASTSANPSSQNSPPALKHFIQPAVQFAGFHPELSSLRLVTSLQLTLPHSIHCLPISLPQPGAHTNRSAFSRLPTLL